MAKSDPEHELLQRLFERAQQLPATARSSFIESKCGTDDGLKQRLKAMLATEGKSNAAASSFTEKLDDAPAVAAQQAIGEGPGSRIGPYKLLQQIGEGGFGSVFLAEQQEPVVRKVALKIIKLGMDTRQVVARFEQERQALALMDHPNIARVLDAGATETGRPYFVMDLVKGHPIVEFCDKDNLTIHERLELFAQVCGAVQHAHGKGIIHRDLKPSNILVGSQDGRPLAKVIDFGIAKATSQKLTDKTLFTEHKQVIGTLQYMSPEQAEGSLDIDTRTDVYSLGILLYELLTGSTPFDQKTLQNALYGEIQRMIREVEPPRPSTRLSESRDTLLKIAAHRRVEPKRLSTMLRGELDWIVMKSLEKDRARRYETANGLAMDIRRYLSGEAVLAAPPSAAYRMRKFVRRHRVMVAGASAVSAALLLGAIAFAWQAREANHQRDLANQSRGEEIEQRKVAERERAQADAQRDRAVKAESESKNRADELALVAEFQSSMLAQIDPYMAGQGLSDNVLAKFAAALAKVELPERERAGQLEVFSSGWSRVNATDAALDLIDHTILIPAIAAIDKQFQQQPVVDAALRTTLGERYFNLGLYAASKPLFEQALALRRRVLGEEHRDTLRAISNVGSVLSRQGLLNEALVYYEEALQKCRRVLGADDPQTLTAISDVGVVVNDLGRREEALSYYIETLEGRRRVLGEEHPETLTSLSNMGALLWDMGRQEEGLKCYEQALEQRRRILGEEHLDTLISLSNMGVALNSVGRYREAVVYLREIVQKRRRLLGDVHPRTLDAIKNLGSALASLGEQAEGEALMREALSGQRLLLGADHQSTLASLNNLAVLLIQQGKTAEAEPMCRESLERQRRVSGPNHPSTLIATSVMGYVLSRQGKYKEAEACVREALAISLIVNGEDHQETLTYLYNLASLESDQLDFEQAESNFRTVMERGRRSLGLANLVTMGATRRLTNLLMDRKQFAEVAEIVAVAEPVARTSLSESDLANLLTQLGTAQAESGLFEQAESNLMEAQLMGVKVNGANHASNRECIRAIVRLYTAWELARPDQGDGAEAAAWQAQLDELK
jgi:serine/threonine protein kinase/tetratricopeptide (TPR) repeat protein